MKKEGPLLLMVLAALAVVVPHYIAAINHTGFETGFDNWVAVTFAAAIGLGLVNMTQVHAANIRKRAAGFGYSIVFLIVMYAFAILGLITGTDQGAFNWIFQNLDVPLGSTVFALLAFQTVSAIYRTFRIRSLEVAAFVLAGLLVMLGAAPIGDVLVPHWSSLSSWLLDVPVSSGFRAVALGVYLGSFGVALRILLGLERGHLSGAR
jgi:hypothetical protein